MKKARFMIAAAMAAVTIVAMPYETAQAQFGGIVYDPRNHAQNIMTAARTLQQINNQVRQLANEAQSLLNEAQNLANLPTSVAEDLQDSLGEVDKLLREAEGLTYRVAEIDDEYRRLFPQDYAAASNSKIIGNARETWRLARDGFKHSLEVQAGVVEQVRADAATLDRLIAKSQGAAGNLQVAQAGNQLTALAAKQSMQLQTLIAASARAEALERARALQVREQAKARLRNFMGDGDAYNPGNR
ncbi:P-type conjugative transfer protein TrbJ [Erythrobacter aureus]|uniref:P-type conjugative transfer protein TrbJ n=1 Tax=Erythrobacter aureus TaxID=2182384 RepID=UPI003A8DE352